MAGELAFFEIGVGDAEQGRRFYAALFGWTFAPGPGSEGGMTIAFGLHERPKG